jgi:archaellin
VIDVTGATTGQTLTYKAMLAKTWSSTDTVTFWAKFGSTGIDQQISFAFNTVGKATDLGNTALTEVLLDMSALPGAPASDTNWHKYTMTIPGPLATAVEYGFYVSGDISGAATETIYIDDIEITDANLYTITDPMATFANSVTFTLGLAASGNPIDFTTDTDTNKNGIFDELNPTHKVIINYNDSTQTVSDLAWTLTKLGSDDGDAMLSGNEKYQLTVDLTYINQHASAGNKIGANRTFTLEVKPPTGAVLTMSRTLPGKIQTVNNLN